MNAIITTCLITFLAFINPQEPLSKVASVKAPKGAEIKNRQEILAYQKQNFKHFSATQGNKNVYKIGGVLLAFRDTEYPKVYHTTLEDTRDRILGEVEEIQAAGTNDKVDIITFNGTRYLVRKRNKGDDYFYMFGSEEKNRKGLEGVLQFKKADLEKADKILSDFLNGVKF